MFTTIRAKIAERLSQIEGLDAVGVVDLKAAFQGNIKRDTAYVYRVESRAGKNESMTGLVMQRETTHYAILLAAKNVSNDDDALELLSETVRQSLHNWKPDGENPLLKLSGGSKFDRNQAMWIDVYSHEQMLLAEPKE